MRLIRIGGDYYFNKLKCSLTIVSVSYFFSLLGVVFYAIFPMKVLFFYVSEFTDLL